MPLGRRAAALDDVRSAVRMTPHWRDLLPRRAEDPFPDASEAVRALRR